MSHDQERTDSGIFCLSTPVESPMACSSKQVTMDSQRARPHSLLARVSSQPVSMSSYGLPSGAYSGADLSRKAEEIVSKVLDTSPCPPQEEVQCPLALAPITEQETPLPSPTNERGDHISQNILHPLHAAYLTVGPDHKYFPSRDYYLNDVGQLGQGGFGTCLCARDNTTNSTFVLKRNSRDEEDTIQSIMAESAILSTLQHEHIVFFYGAVLDIYPSNARKCNMMIEFAEHGSLSDLLREGEPLPHGQALYYLTQIMLGVHYLHNSSIMHLDIKTPNVLVYNLGKTVKLADFGTSVSSADLATHRLKGVTPNYAAPEVVRQESPRFASDIWSALCVFVEMITAKLPWCYHDKEQSSFHNTIYMVGKYRDTLEDIVPVSELEGEDTVLELCRSVFKNDYKVRPTAVDLLGTPLLTEALEYEKVLDAYTEGSGSGPDDASINDTNYGQVPCGQVPWDLSNCHVQEERSSLPPPSPQAFLSSPGPQTFLPSPGLQAFTGITHSAPSSMSSPRRRFSLGITSTMQDSDVERDSVSRCKAVQRSVSFSETYVDRGPEIDLPTVVYRPSSAQCSSYSSIAQARTLPCQKVLQVPNQRLNDPQSNPLTQSDSKQSTQSDSKLSNLLTQSDSKQSNLLTQSDQSTQSNHSTAQTVRDTDETRSMQFKYIV